MREVLPAPYLSILTVVVAVMITDFTNIIRIIIITVHCYNYENNTTTTRIIHLK